MNYVEKQFSKHDYLTIRNDYMDDIRGQRTGFKTKYTEHLVGWGLGRNDRSLPPQDFCNNHPSDVILCTCDEGSSARDLVLHADGEQDRLGSTTGLQKPPVSRIAGEEMNNGGTNRAAQPRRIGQSILALFAGFVAGVALSLGTDLGLHAVGLWPSLGQPMSGQLLVFATVYRTIYGIISAYIVTRLAPFGPMEHALIGGAIGTLLSITGAVVTWNRGLGPHWYPVALIFVALPSAWVGGRLRLAQLRTRTAA